MVASTQGTGRASEVERFVRAAEAIETAEILGTSKPSYRSILRNFALRLCVAATITIALLVAGEVYFYWRSVRSASENTLEPEVKMELAHGSAADREYWREFEHANKVTYEPYVLWRRAPYQGDMVAVNADGTRRTMNTRCDGPAFTIWTFGDSVMWGTGAPDSETIPSLLAADYQRAGRPACIVNYAEKGWANTQEVIGLIELLKHTSRKPDAVVFYDGGTEAFTAYQNGAADVHSNYNGFKQYLDNWSTARRAGFLYLEETNTYRFLEKLGAKSPLHRKQQDPAAQALDNEALSEAVTRNYVQNMDITELLAKQYGFRTIFAWYPNMAVGHKQLAPYEQQVLQMENQKFPGMVAMYQAVYNRGRELNRPDFYYLGDMLDDQKDSLYLGISHLRPQGYQVTADKLFDILEHPPNAAVPKIAGRHGK